MTNAINKIIKNPKQLFLLDGLGALLSAFLLGVVLVKFESIFGMPKNTLYFLAALPCFFALYDLLCYYFVDNWRPFIRAIAIANLLYCGISIGMLYLHYHLLTALGLTYFVLEIIIVIAVAYIEFKAINNKDILA